jgi:hypothetical protein
VNLEPWNPDRQLLTNDSSAVGHQRLTCRGYLPLNCSIGLRLLSTAAGFGPDTPSMDTRINSKMIRKLKSGEYRLYSRKKNPTTGKKRNLGTFATLEKAKQHEREVQYFKKH